MKGLIKITGIFVVLLMLSSCVVHEYHGRRGLPPGQAKKVYGGSAKYYAPGQVKKRGYYYYDYGTTKHGHGKHHKD